MKSWRTTSLGIFCIVCALWGALDNFHRNAIAFRYWQNPIALLAAGVGLIHARDHKHKD